MIALTLTRPFAALIRPRRAPKTVAKGPLPKWRDDPQLSQKLLQDTGLSPEDLGLARGYDPKRPFFMQSPQR